MDKTRTFLTWVLFFGVSMTSALVAEAACPAANASIPPGANTTDPSAPFFIDTTGLNFNTAPPTRDPSNLNYPPATELPDGALPAEGSKETSLLDPLIPRRPKTPLRMTSRKDRFILSR